MADKTIGMRKRQHTEEPRIYVTMSYFHARKIGTILLFPFSTSIVSCPKKIDNSKIGNLKIENRDLKKYVTS